MDKVRWGLVSTARINRRVIPAIRMSPRGELVAVASRNGEKAKAYAAEWDIPRTFDSYTAMFQSDAVDAVYISVPNQLHAPLAIEALEAGKHVLCEKPMATTLKDVDAMIAASRRAGNILTEAFMYRHHPQTKLVGEWVRSGRLGDVRMVRGNFSFTLTDSTNVRLSADLHGGSLWDVGVYPLSFAQYVMGESPQAVWATQQLSEGGVDVYFAAQMMYSGGRVAQIESSFDIPFRTYAEVSGTAGRLQLTRPFTNVDAPDQAVTFIDDNDHVQQLTVPDEYLYLGEVEDLQASILDGRESYLSLTETRNHIRTALALYKSATEGRVVALSELD